MSYQIGMECDTILEPPMAIWQVAGYRRLGISPPLRFQNTGIPDLALGTAI